MIVEVKKGVNHLNVDVRAEDPVLAHSFFKNYDLYTLFLY